MTDKPAVYDFAALNRKAEELAAERQANIMGTPIEDPKPAEAPADIDWTGMYGYQSTIAWTEWGEPYNVQYLAKAQFRA